jgi:hypothetical protein
MSLRVASRSEFVVWALLLAACAYPREPVDRPTTIPVYLSESDVPCPFEVMQRIEAQGSVPFPSSRADQDRERERVLVRAGARVGADAVLLVPTRMLGSGVIGIQTDTMPSTLRLDFVGDAIRFLPGTCRP